MLNKSRKDKWINFNKLIFRGTILAALLVLQVDSVRGQCTHWSARGRVTIIQRGSTYRIHLDLQQNGKVLTGKAQYTTNGGTHRNGLVDGTIAGNSLSVQIFWDGQLTGVYNAKVLPSGRLDGETFDKNKSTVRQTWHSEEILKCVSPSPGFSQTFGGQLNPGKPSPKKNTPPKPPFILASPPIISTPMHPLGIVTLGWDGGPDHPNVAVWLSMDRGTEIPAFSTEHSPRSPVWKQSKASIQLHLQRYHHYQFVLKSAGKTLSTAAFVVP